MSEPSKWEPSPAPGDWTKRKVGAFTVYASAARHRATIYAGGEMIHEEYVIGPDQGSAQAEAEAVMRALLTRGLAALGPEPRRPNTWDDTDDDDVCSGCGLPFCECPKEEQSP